MIADQPGDGLGLGRRRARSAGTSSQRHLGAEHAMVAAAALGDVVQQHRDIEHPARRDLPEQGGRRADGRRLELAALDRAPAGRSPGSNARRPYNGGTCRTASGRRPGRSRERSGRTRRPRSSSAAPVSGSRGAVSTSRNKALARGSSRTSRRSACASRAAARIASRMDLQPVARGEREQSRPAAPGPWRRSRRSGSTSRPRSSTKPSSCSGRRRSVGRAKRRPLLRELARRDGRGTRRSGRRPSSR